MGKIDKSLNNTVGNETFQLGKVTVESSILSWFILPSKTPTPIATATLQPTAQPTLAMLAPAPTKPTIVVSSSSAGGTGNSQPRPDPVQNNLPLVSAAVAAMAAAAAYALQRKREEDEAAEEQEAKMRAKARAKAEAEWDRERTKKNVQPRGRKLDDVTEAERLAAYKQTDRYKNYQSSTQAWEQKKKDEQLHAYDDVENMRAGRTIPPPTGPSWAPAEPTTFIGENPHPVPPTVPEPQIGPKEAFDASCQVADAIDPRSPDPAFVGTKLGWSEAIDQAAISVEQMPLTGSPVPDTFISMAKLAMPVAVTIKDTVSTGYNIACQQINREGPYYEALPLDKTGIYIKNQWNNMTTIQKITFVSIAVAAVVIAIPVILTLL